MIYIVGTQFTASRKNMGEFENGEKYELYNISPSPNEKINYIFRNVSTDKNINMVFNNTSNGDDYIAAVSNNQQFITAERTIISKLQSAD